MATRETARPIREFLAQRVRALKSGEREQLLAMAEGRKDLARLGRGDPDLATPPHIVEAARRALLEGETHYTHWQGRSDLRQAICDKYAREQGLAFAPGQVLVTAGAQEAVYVTFQTLLDPGDEVVMADPHYSVYSLVIRLAGGVPVLVPTRAEDDFVVRPEEVERRITARTKVLVLVSPDNPTGAVIPAERLARLAEIARRHDLIVVMDEIYEKFVYDGHTHASIAREPGMSERTVVINGFSKSYAMTGWRAGFLIAPEAIVQHMETLHNSLLICAPAVSQAAALAALTGPQDAVEEMRRTYAERRALLLRRLTAMGLPCRGSRGALYVYPSIEATGLSSFDFCVRMLEAGVQVFPGTTYGGGAGYIRISFLQPIETLRTAMDRMEPVVRALTARV